MKIKVGDKVRLKDKFYDEPDFKNEDRYHRVHLAKNKGFVLPVDDIHYNSYSKQTRVVSKENKGDYTIPISLLEKVEEPVVQEENTIEARVGMWFERIGFDNGLKTGEKYQIASINATGDYLVNINGDTMLCLPKNAKLLPHYYSKQQEADQRKFERRLNNVLDRNPQNFRKWTKEEVTEAKCFIAEFIIRLNGNGYSVTINYHSTIRIDARIVAGTLVKTASARCSKKDEYNPYIGTMVALCKATNLAMPDWVNNH